MPKLSPLFLKRNEIMKTEYNEKKEKGFTKYEIIQELSDKYFLTPVHVRRIVTPQRWGLRGGKLKSKEEHLEAVKKINAENREKRKQQLRTNNLDI